MQTGRQLNAHFTNIQLFNFDPSSTRLPHDFDDQIDHLFPEKYSLAHYHPQSIRKRKILNERKAALERQREFDEVMADLEEVPLSQRFPRDRNRHQNLNSQNSENSECEDSFHLEQLFEQDDQTENQDNDFDLISFEEPLQNTNFDTPDTFFESNDLNDLDDTSLDELAQPNISPSNLFVKTPQHSNLQQSQLERESTSFHDTLEHNLDLNPDPPHSQASSSDAPLTDANLRQNEQQQDIETSTTIDTDIELNDNLNNDQELQPQFEPPTVENDQQRDNDHSQVEDSNSGPLIPRYNLRDRIRVNPYTFSGRVSEKWVDNRRRKNH
jgi:hypothetical protein